MRSSRHYVATVALVAAFGGLLFGYDTGVMSGALLFLAPDFGLSPSQEGLVTSMLLAGAAVGALGGGGVAEAVGRRMALLGGGVVFVVGSLWCAAAGSVGSMAAARTLLGLAVGGVSIIAPMYIAEMVPPRVRGRLVSLNTLMIVVGQLSAYLVNSSLAHTENWRLMLGLAAVPGLVLALGMVFLPDTPAWYATRGRMDRAAAVAGRLGLEVPQPAVKQRRSGSEWAQLRAHPGLAAATGVAVGLGVIQQVTGVNSVIYFAPTMMNKVGLPAQDSVYTSIVIGVVSVAACAVGLRIVDRVGRRRLLIVGLAGNVVSLLALAAGYHAAQNSRAAALAALGAMALFMAFQQAAVSLATWLLISELVPGAVRGLGMGLAGLALWVVNWAVAQFFLPVVQAVGGPATFIGFAGAGVVAVIFVLRLVPETTGRTLDHVTREFMQRYEPQDEPRN